MNVLNVNEKVLVDNSIVGAEFHTHQPYTTRFENNDEIRIPIQEDMSTLPSRSYLYVEGTVLKEDGKPSASGKFINNGIAYLFSEIRYEMNGVVVDSVTKVGLTTTMKAYLSHNSNESVKLQNAGWFPDGTSTLLDSKGNFCACIPLSTLLGIFEDYGKIIMNIRQELVLIRSNSDVDALISTDANEKLKVNLQKIYWKVPHIQPGLAEELSLTKYIGKNIDTQVAFRSWETHIYPAVPQTDKHSWSIKTSTTLETPRYVIIGFQTDRDGQLQKDMSTFDACDIQNVTVFLNTERYPYDQLNINYGENRYATLYEMYANFQRSYYDKPNEPLLAPDRFKALTPLIVIDCSRQKDSLLGKAVVLRVTFETHKSIPANTTAYCLILHDRVFTYNALTKQVRQL